MKWVLFIGGVVALCFLSYRLGVSHQQIKIVTKQVEVIKYVETEKARIRSRPVAGRNELLQRMRAGKL